MRIPCSVLTHTVDGRDSSQLGWDVEESEVMMSIFHAAVVHGVVACLYVYLQQTKDRPSSPLGLRSGSRTSTTCVHCFTEVLSVQFKKEVDKTHLFRTGQLTNNTSTIHSSSP